MQHCALCGLLCIPIYFGVRIAWRKLRQVVVDVFEMFAVCRVLTKEARAFLEPVDTAPSCLKTTLDNIDVTLGTATAATNNVSAQATAVTTRFDRVCEVLENTAFYAKHVMVFGLAASILKSIWTLCCLFRLPVLQPQAEVSVENEKRSVFKRLFAMTVVLSSLCATARFLNAFQTLWNFAHRVWAYVDSFGDGTNHVCSERCAHIQNQNKRTKGSGVIIDLTAANLLLRRGDWNDYEQAVVHEPNFSSDLLHKVCGRAPPTEPMTGLELHTTYQYTYWYHLAHINGMSFFHPVIPGVRYHPNGLYWSTNEHSAFTLKELFDEVDDVVARADPMHAARLQQDRTFVHLSTLNQQYHSDQPFTAPPTNTGPWDSDFAGQSTDLPEQVVTQARVMEFVRRKMRGEPSLPLWLQITMCGFVTIVGLMGLFLWALMRRNVKLTSAARDLKDIAERLPKTREINTCAKAAHFKVLVNGEWLYADEFETKHPDYYDSWADQLSHGNMKDFSKNWKMIAKTADGGWADWDVVVLNPYTPGVDEGMARAMATDFYDEEEYDSKRRNTSSRYAQNTEGLHGQANVSDRDEIYRKIDRMSDEEFEAFVAKNFENPTWMSRVIENCNKFAKGLGYGYLVVTLAVASQLQTQAVAQHVQERLKQIKARKVRQAASQEEALNALVSDVVTQTKKKTVSSKEKQSPLEVGDEIVVQAALVTMPDDKKPEAVTVCLKHNGAHLAHGVILSPGESYKQKVILANCVAHLTVPISEIVLEFRSNNTLIVTKPGAFIVLRQETEAKKGSASDYCLYTIDPNIDKPAHSALQGASSVTATVLSVNEPIFMRDIASPDPKTYSAMLGYKAIEVANGFALIQADNIFSKAGYSGLPLFQQINGTMKCVGIHVGRYQTILGEEKKEIAFLVFAGVKPF